MFNKSKINWQANKLINNNVLKANKIILENTLNLVTHQSFFNVIL